MTCYYLHEVLIFYYVPPPFLITNGFSLGILCPVLDDHNSFLCFLLTNFLFKYSETAFIVNLFIMEELFEKDRGAFIIHILFMLYL